MLLRRAVSQLLGVFFWAHLLMSVPACSQSFLSGADQVTAGQVASLHQNHNILTGSYVVNGCMQIDKFQHGWATAFLHVGQKKMEDGAIVYGVLCNENSGNKFFTYYCPKKEFWIPVVALMDAGGGMQTRFEDMLAPQLSLEGRNRDIIKFSFRFNSGKMGQEVLLALYCMKEDKK
jgi:hypothetical protein